MRISDISTELVPGALRLEATFDWEDSERASQRIFFRVETEDGSEDSVDANVFLLVAYPIAVAHREKRISLGEPTSPLLRERLREVHGWWRKWGYARFEPPAIESFEAANVGKGKRAHVGFLSGGVDSLHMLYRNHARFPKDSSYRLDEAIFIRGYDPNLSEKDRDEVYGHAARSVTAIAAQSGLKLHRVSTNLRALDPSLSIWVQQFHGSAMAATAHAVMRGNATAHFAATFDIANMAPWGSHPLIDPNLGTERISVLHCGSSFSRLDKVRELLSWPEAIANLWVCTAQLHGIQNCGRCEKCIRTKLEIVAAGGDVPDVFADRTVDPARLPQINNAYQRSCYAELVEPLRRRGMNGLATAVGHAVRFADMPPQLRQLRRWKRTTGRTLRRFMRGARFAET